MDFSERLSILIKNQGITAKSLAVKLNIGATAISDWKRGKSSPSPQVLIGISQIFNVSIDYLLTGIEVEKNSRFEESDYTLEDQHIIKLYHDCPDDVKKEILEYIEFKYTKAQQVAQQVRQEAANQQNLA
jgi:transcriptional regulator with XRE-family HTH domain